MGNRISWTWRHAITKSELKPTTRHVLLTISLHMNEMGQGAYPTTAKLADETGLSERAVITHIQEAKDAGWLRVKQHGFRGQKWKNHEYEAQWPSETGDGKGTERGSAAWTKGTEPNDKKALNEVQSNVSDKHSRDISSAKGFDEFWEAYAHKKGKEAALKVWKRKNLASKAQEVIAGAKAYVKTRGDDPRYWKHPQGWLNDGRWEDHGSVSEPKSAAVDWENRARMFYDKGIWLPDWGPSPDYSGCECPPEFLRTLGREAAK